MKMYRIEWKVKSVIGLETGWMPMQANSKKQAIENFKIINPSFTITKVELIKK